MYPIVVRLKCRGTAIAVPMNNGGWSLVIIQRRRSVLWVGTYDQYLDTFLASDAILGLLELFKAMATEER